MTQPKVIRVDVEWDDGMCVRHEGRDAERVWALTKLDGYLPIAGTATLPASRIERLPLATKGLNVEHITATIIKSPEVN